MIDLPWAGIGARKTPPQILDQMTILARRMDEAGWHLRSGGADGADSSFAAGAHPQRRTIFLPWAGYNGLSGPDCQVPTNNQLQQWLAIAERLHPAWHKCGRGVRRLHARNVSILLGPDLDRPVKAVVCWTERGQAVGGTGMGLRIAAEHAIPIFNLGSMKIDQAWASLRLLRNSISSAATDAPSPGAASLETLTRTYRASDACVFRFTKADWGVFSNFAPLPDAISAAGNTWPTSEHLYQAAKFRLSSAVQQEIAAAPTAREAAKIGRDRDNTPDADWMSRRTDAMRWVIRMKREANRDLIDSALDRTGQREIVEYSRHDAFWGAKPDGTWLVGRNVLGRLWMELRQQIGNGDPRALASAWPDPLNAAPQAAREPTHHTDANLQAAQTLDAEHDERTRINNGYLALLEATNQTPALIPYQGNFARFRDDVTAALAAARQPPEYLERLKALDQRLSAESDRSQRASNACMRLEDLLVQLPRLQQTTATSDSIIDGFSQDCADCLAQWHELARDPDMTPHMNQVASDDLSLRIAALAPYADRCEPVSQNHGHPVIREYNNLLGTADDKPELLACQPGFETLRHQVQHALSSPTTNPEEHASLQRISSTLDDSYRRLCSIRDLQRQFSHCANGALDLEDWAAARPDARLTDCPDYDAWRKNADALIDRYHHMNSDRAFSPHLRDRAEVRAYFLRRLAHLSEPHLQRPAPLTAQQAVQQRQSRTAEHDTAYSMGL